MAILEKAVKDDPDLIRARIAVMAGLGELAQVKPLVEALPETSRGERLYKAAAAQAAKLSVLAERLMRGLYEEELRGDGQGLKPEEIADLKGYAGTQMLVRSLLAEKKREEAINITRAALARDSASARLKIIERVLEGKAQPDELGGLFDELSAQAGTPSGDQSRHIAVLRKADMYRQQGDSEEALKQLLAADDGKSEDDAELLKAIFLTALEVKKLDVAERCVPRLVKLNADHADGLYFRTKLKLARRDFNGALEDATNLTRKLEAFASSWVVKGQAEQGLNRYDSAIASYGRAVDRQADNVEALQGLIECHVAINQLANAKGYLRQGMRTSYASYFAELDRRFEERYGDPKSVTAAREKEVRDNPDSLQAALAMVQNYLYVSDNLSGKKDKAGAQSYIARAQDALAGMIRKWPDEISVVDRLSGLLERDRKNAEALRVLQDFAGRDAWKSKPQPWLMIAQHHQRNKDLQKAEEAYLKALSLSANSPAIRRQLALFYLQIGQEEKGVAALKSLATDTGDADVRTMLIEILVSRRRIPEAEALVREDLARNPNDARLLALRGFISMTPAKPGDRPDFDVALKFIEQALKIDPQNSTAHYYRGMIRLTRGKKELAGAIADLTAARNFNPNNADIRNGLFDALRRRGQIDEAANELESALVIDPLRRDLRQKLLTVYSMEKRWVQAERLIEETKRIPQLATEALWRKIEAQMWLSRDDLDRALAPILVASQLAPNDPEVNYTYLDINLRKKDFDEVITVTNRIIDRGMEKPWWMWMCRAAALKGKGRFAEAEAAFDSALTGVDAIQDDMAAERLAVVMTEQLGAARTAEKLAIRVRPYWLLCLVRVHATDEKWEKAAQVADELLAKHMASLPLPLKLRASSYLGQMYTAACSKGIAGAMEKAESIYSQFLADAEAHQIALPAQLQALNNLAYLFAEGPQPNLPKALNFSRKAYDLMVESEYIDPVIADTHGWVLILNNRVDEGIDVLVQRVLTVDRPIPDAHYHLAEAYLKRSQLEEAQASMEQARAALKRARESGAFVDPSLESRFASVDRKIEQAAKSGKQPKAENNP